MGSGRRSHFGNTARRAALVAASAAGLALPAQVLAQPRLENDRWAEVWSGSRAPLKDIALSPLRVDFGADVRWKVEAVENPGFGLTNEDDDSWLQQRLLAHANLRAGDAVRLFVQLGAFDVRGRERPGANDDNRFDLQQGFVDLTPEVEGFEARLRVGRQELGADNDFNPRFLGAGDGPNIRRRYDGVRLTLNSEAWRLDAISIRPTANEPGTFDDGPSPGEHIFGGLIERRTEAFTLRAYAFDYARRSVALAGVTADGQRRTYGLLFMAARGPYALETDIAREDGEHGAFDVAAWGGYAGVTRIFPDAPWSPRVTLRMTYASGDGDPADRVIETYAPPVPLAGWFVDGGFFGFSNIVEAAVLTSLQPRAGLRVDVKLAGLWRATSDDFIYAARMPLPGTRGGDEFIGVAPRLQIRLQANRHVTLRGDLSAVLVSDRVAALGGRDGKYANASIAFRY